MPAYVQPLSLADGVELGSVVLTYDLSIGVLLVPGLPDVLFPGTVGLWFNLDLSVVQRAGAPFQSLVGQGADRVFAIFIALGTGCAFDADVVERGSAGVL